jgi:uncharacterized protein with PQ loop repeat
MGIETLGWIGTFLLALCGLPQLIKTATTKNTTGLSLLMLVACLLGEIFIGIFIYYTAFEWQLFFNFSVNALIVTATIILYIIYRKN